MGSFATKGKEAVRRWRESGRKVGLLRLRLFRPFPAADVATALVGRRAIGVIDQNISPGLGGILFHELATAVATASQEPPVMRSFIGGLGGKDISPTEFDHVLDVLEHADVETTPVRAELLLTEQEWEQVQGRLATAGKVPAEATP
jgi:pyruvate ferredoxin oxidoreductase alpha subunit